MTTSYETFEIIASHHAELDRLCDELLEFGSRVSLGEPEASELRERARALAWRVREHLTEESAALLNDVSGDGRRVAELMDRRREEGERMERALAQAERQQAPMDLVNAVCAIARDARACLDRVALS